MGEIVSHRVNFEVTNIHCEFNEGRDVRCACHVEKVFAGDAICTKRQVVDVVDRPQDIQDEAAMSFFGGEEGDADLSQG